MLVDSSGKVLRDFVFVVGCVGWRRFDVVEEEAVVQSKTGVVECQSVFPLGCCLQNCLDNSLAFQRCVLDFLIQTLQQTILPFDSSLQGFRGEEVPEAFTLGVKERSPLVEASGAEGRPGRGY